MSRALQCRIHTSRERLAGIARTEHRDSRDMRNRLLEQLEIFRRQLLADEGKPREVPSWVGQGRREAGANGVPDADENYGRRIAQIPHGRGRRRAESHDHLELEGRQLAREQEKLVPITVGKAVLQSQILPIDVAEIPQPLFQGHEARRVRSCGPGAEAQEPDVALLPRLLRLYNERRGEEAASNHRVEPPASKRIAERVASDRVGHRPPMENARIAGSLTEADGLKAEKSKVILPHGTGRKGTSLIGRRRRLGLGSPP